jgi:hypothetical protein
MRVLMLLILLGLFDVSSILQAEENSRAPIVCDAVCRYPLDKIRENQEAIEAGQHQAYLWTQAHPSIPEIPVEPARLVEIRAPRPRTHPIPMPMPMMPMMFSCTSFNFGMFATTDCF